MAITLAFRRAAQSIIPGIVEEVLFTIRTMCSASKKPVTRNDIAAVILEPATMLIGSSATLCAVHWRPASREHRRLAQRSKRRILWRRFWQQQAQCGT